MLKISEKRNDSFAIKIISVRFETAEIFRTIFAENAFSAKLTLRDLKRKRKRIFCLSILISDYHTMFHVSSSFSRKKEESLERILLLHLLCGTAIDIR